MRLNYNINKINCYFIVLDIKSVAWQKIQMNTREKQEKK